MSLISLPLFRSNNTEKLEAADAYDLTSTRPINKIYEASKNTANRLYSQVGGAEGLARGMVNLLEQKSYGATGKQLLESGLGMFNTSTVGILKTMGEGVLDKAAAFIDMDPEMVTRVKAAGDEVVRQVQYGDPRDISNYGNLLGIVGDLTGNAEFSRYINIGYESAVWGAALSEAAGYGQYQYFGDVKQYIDPEVYRQAVIYSLPVIATSGSLDALKNVIQELGPDVVIAHKPDMIRVFLSRFKLPVPEPLDKVGYANEVVDTLNLLDARWYLYRRDGTDIFDISMLTGASTEAIVLLNNHAIVGPLIQIAPHFPEVTTDEVLREQYPLMVTNLT